MPPSTGQAYCTCQQITRDQHCATREPLAQNYFKVHCCFYHGSFHLLVKRRVLPTPLLPMLYSTADIRSPSIHMSSEVGEAYSATRGIRTPGSGQCVTMNSLCRCKWAGSCDRSRRPRSQSSACGEERHCVEQRCQLGSIGVFEFEQGP
jgi:hypothetical protein